MCKEGNFIQINIYSPLEISYLYSNFLVKPDVFFIQRKTKLKGARTHEKSQKEDALIELVSENRENFYRLAYSYVKN